MVTSDDVVNENTRNEIFVITKLKISKVLLNSLTRAQNFDIHSLHSTAFALTSTEHPRKL